MDRRIAELLNHSGGLQQQVVSLTSKVRELEATAAYHEAELATAPAPVPTFGDLGARVGKILELAEEEAADIRLAAAHLVAAFSARIGAALDTLQARHGITFEVLDGFLYPGHSVRRMHAVPQKTGAALVAQLERVATAAGADIVTQATVRELWVDRAGRITGVGYERPDGRIEPLRCDALILACNGFGGNPAMVRELLPEMREALFAGHTGNDGSAITWGRATSALGPTT